MHQIYEEGLKKSPANYEPLSPLSFLLRSSQLYPDKTATVYEDERMSWREFHIECKKVASALAEEGVGWALDEHNESLITDVMKSTIKGLANKVVAGDIKVHDYLSDNNCPS